MVFSSQLFIYVFMPVFFSLYYIVPERQKNWLILTASLIFYSVGAGSTVLVLVISIWVNQFLAVRIEHAPARRRAVLLAIGVMINLLGLGYYKYGSFLWRLASDLVVAVGFDALPAAPEIPLPIGISFFTFQAVSYLIDVYRREIPAAASYGEFAVYHTLFPQLVAGPIVRYREIGVQLYERHFDLSSLSNGVYRFCLGFGKKIILADNLGMVADQIIKLPSTELTFGHAWLGMVCYGLQIY